MIIKIIKKKDVKVLKKNGTNTMSIGKETITGAENISDVGGAMTGGLLVEVKS